VEDEQESRAIAKPIYRIID